MTNHCPFCGNYAYAASVGDAYQLDCRYCDIQVEITKKAYAARCPNPVAVLDYIREKMKRSTRPRVELADMKRTWPPLAPRQEEEMISDLKPAGTPEPDSDVLTTAAKAIGTTLGKIAVKTGIAKPAASVTKVARKAAPKRTSPVKRKAASKPSPKKSTLRGRGNKAAPKGKPGK